MSLSGYFIILVMNRLMNNEPKATIKTDFEEMGWGSKGGKDAYCPWAYLT